MDGVDKVDTKELEELKPITRCNRHQDGDLVFQRTPGMNQFGRWNCDQCGRFVIWCRKPKNQARLEVRRKKLVNLLQEYAPVMLKDEIRRTMALYNKNWLSEIEQGIYLRLLHNYDMIDE